MMSIIIGRFIYPRQERITELLSVKNLIKIHNKNIIAARFSSKC